MHTPVDVSKHTLRVLNHSVRALNGVLRVKE
jgi:hypothetical protein